MISGDFETRSAVDLKKVGPYEYAKHESTEVICFAHKYHDAHAVHLWHPGFEDLSYKQMIRVKDQTRRDLTPQQYPHELLMRIQAGELFEAHNAFFERCIWYFQMVRKYDWPEVHHEQWRCSAAKVAAFAMRAKLEHAAKDLKVSIQKDMAGNRTMLKLAKPRKATKADPDSPWHQTRRDLLTVFGYCIGDVRTEEAVSDQLRPLNPTELRVWQLDQLMNWRGMHCDRKLIEGALKIEAKAKLAAAKEIEAITYGCVEGPTKRVDFIKWLVGEEVDVPQRWNVKAEEMRYSTDKASLAEMLEEGQVEHVQRAIEVWQSANKASKYQGFIDKMSDDDDRVRDTIRYCAAATGRFGGKRPQPHNMKRDVPDDHEQQCQDVATGDYDLVSVLYGRDQILNQTSNIVRGAIDAAPNHKLYVWDYSAIEARGVFWGAGHAEGLELFRKIDAGELQCIYCCMADEIYQLPIGTTKKSDDKKRQKGKVGVLGCGYQMGAAKLVSYSDSMGIEISEEDAERVVKSYRATHWPVKNLWKDTNDAAMQAISYPGKVVDQGVVQWCVTGRFLHMRLPSGRLLSYCDPKIELTEKPWGWRDTITFTGVDTYTRQWKRCETYGGKLVENMIQALCRDLMVEAMLRCEDNGYPVVLTVHDEIVAEVPNGFGDPDEYRDLLCEIPTWAKGFPLVAAGAVMERYTKA